MVDERNDLLKPMSTTEILDNTFKIYGRNFLTVLIFSAVIGGIYTLVTYLVSVQMMPVPQDTWTQILENPDGVPQFGPESITEMLPKIFAFQGAMFLLAIINGVFIQPFIQGGIINLTYKDIIGHRLSIGEGIRDTLGKFWKLILTSLSLIPYYIGVGIVMIILAVVLLIPLIVSGVAMSNDPTGGRVAGFIVMMILTVALLIILAILSGLFIIFTYQGAVIEGNYGFAGIGRSFKLVSKRFWRVLGVSLVIFLIFAIISGILAFISAITSLLSPSPLMAEFGIGFVITAFIAPIIHIATTLLFIDVKARAEGIQGDIVV
ncbi:MAG: hypothetical protein GX375_00410 [Clostridiales bacterium]|nr:hypothetical protein [Clostridiales bacterium]